MRFLKDFKFGFFAFALIFCTSFESFGQRRTAPPASPSAKMVAMLPESDAVITLEARELFDKTVPELLGSNERLLANLNESLNRLQSQTGLDFRRVDHVVAGMTLVRNEKAEISYEPIMLATGKFDADIVAELVQVISENKFSKELIGGKEAFRFLAPEPVTQKDSGSSILDTVLQSLISGLNRELVVVSLDGETLAIGSPRKIEDTILKRTRISSEMRLQVGRRAGSLMNAVAFTPQGLEEFVKLDDDTLGEDLASIRMIQATLQSSKTGVRLAMTARTESASKALSLKDTLDGFKAVLPSTLITQKGEDKKVYGRMLDSMRIARTGTTISMELTLPKTDIDVLLAN